MRWANFEGEPLAVNQQTAARLLGISVATLRRWERQGRGPPALRMSMSRLVRYRPSDLKRFLARFREER